MIVENQKVKVKWNGNNRNIYESKGYIFSKFKEEFEVDIKDLPNSSNLEVIVICDVCGKDKLQSYSTARKSNAHYCSKECRKNHNKLDKEFLINEFHRFFKQNGYYPHQNDMQVQSGYPSHYYYTKLWGSWNNFIDEMGIKSGQGRWLKEDIETLKIMYENYSKEQIVDKLINKFHWSNICLKARELGLTRKYKKQSKIAHSKEFLISEFWRYYEEFGIYPYRKDLKNNIGYPSEAGYVRLWGNWDIFLKDIGVVSKDNKDGWYICDENVLIEKYYEESQEDIINALMIKRKWNTIITKANSLGLKRNVSKIKQVFSDDCLISILKEYYNKNNRSPRCEEFDDKNNEYPSPTLYQKRFGSWNNALQLAGLELNAEFNITKEEIIIRAITFYKENNRSPYWNELGFSRGVYEKYWNVFPDMLSEAGLPLNKKTRVDHFKTDEELIEDYISLYNILGRIPIANDVNINSSMASFETYKKRFGGYRELWDKCGIENKTILDESVYGFICLDKNGEPCKSYAEMVITNVFIDNNVEYIKEYKYENLIPELSGKRFAMDWYLPEHQICVEYFGLYRESHLNKDGRIGEYSRKAEKKKGALSNNGFKLIDLYPYDLNETYLQRMVSKFRKYNISLKVNQKNLYKNNKEKIVL